MNKLSVAILFLFTAITLIVLAACQSNPPESAAETVTDSSAAASGDPAPEEPTAAPTPTATIEPTQAPTAVPIATATAVPTETPAPTAEPGVIRTYEIIPDKSEVRFKIDEVLLGNPKTVVGRTNQVTGNIVLDLQNPQAVEVGPIQVNARELTTDDSFRNRALRRQILDSSQDDFQYITFTPIAVEGISSAATAVGETQCLLSAGI